MLQRVGNRWMEFSVGTTTLLHFDDRADEFCARSLRAGLPTAIRGEQHRYFRVLMAL